MGRDTIQLENAVSTISQEYLLEFTSEYGIPEGLHPELPGLEETIVDFLKGKVGVYTKFFEFANFRIPISQFLFDILGYYQIHLSQLSVIGATKVSHFEINYMDLFNLISAPNPTKVKTETRPRAAHEVPLLTVTASRVIDMEDAAVVLESSGTPSTIEKRRKTGNNEEEVNAPPKVLRRDHDAFRSAQSTHKGKSLASMGLDAGSLSSMPAAQDPSTAIKSVIDPEPLSYTKPQLHPEQDIAQSSKGTAIEIPTEDVATAEVNVQFSMGSPESGRSISVPSVVRSPSGVYQPGWVVTNDCRLDTSNACQDIVDHIVPPGPVESEVHGLQNQNKNLKTLLEAEVNKKKAAEAKNAELAKELDSLHLQFSDLQAAFEEFKKYEDDKVNSGMSEGLKYGIEHGKSGQDLANVEAYNPKANSKLVKALQDLKDLKYQMVDQLERLKDHPMELLMASLH
ncbi:hypothetical protein Tco_1121677 [Tanacetum coccineum]|uniref:Transposase (Putative), gypsy type n=1 Tax=Tanacetum coccineum TaxID=301880 RepID=A0ABQ5IYC7_9ASTR